MPSMKTGVILTAELNLIIGWMLHNWAVKCIATLGASPGPGAVSSNQAVTEKGNDYSGETTAKDWIQEWDGEVPDWTFVGGKIPEVALLIQAQQAEASLTGSLLTRFDVARQEVMWAMRRAVLNFEAQMLREKSYRAWSIIEGAKTIAAKEQIEGLSKVFLGLLPKRKRDGRQIVSTRRQRRLPKGSFLQFSGRPAWRGRPGRPPLPEHEWRTRYNQRLERRRKSNKTRRRRSKGGVTVPSTLTVRPPHEVKLGE